MGCIRAYVFKINQNSPYVILKCKNRKYIFLADTGAAVSVFKAESLNNNKINNSNKIQISGISEDPFFTLGTSKLNFETSKFPIHFDFHILPENSTSLKTDGILGMDFFENFKAEILFTNWKIKINNKNRSVTLPLHNYDILNYTIAPLARSYVQMYTNWEKPVYIEEQIIQENVILYGNLQTPKN